MDATYPSLRVDVDEAGPYIVLSKFDGHDYDIPMHQCATADEIIKWALQIADKTWVTNELVGKFVLTACDINGIRLG